MPPVNFHHFCIYVINSIAFKVKAEFYFHRKIYSFFPLEFWLFSHRDDFKCLIVSCEVLAYSSWGFFSLRKLKERVALV